MPRPPAHPLRRPQPRRALGFRSRSFTPPNSGNAEGVGADLKKAAGKQGFAAKLLDMAEVSPAEVADQRNLLVVASTWGEGDPPERAAEFYKALMAEDAPRFDGVRFAVLALGDSSYVNFCEVGRRIDARLEALGGERIAPRVECDLDYEAQAAAWSGGALEELARRAEPDPATVVPGGDIIHVDFAAPATVSLYSKANPFPAEITESINLNSSRSTKQTIHLELSLEGSGLAYEPGDSLGIVPENDPAMVDAVLRAADSMLTMRCGTSSAASSTSRCCRVRSWRPMPRSPRTPSCATCSRVTAGAPMSRAGRSSICSRISRRSWRRRSSPACCASCRRASTRSPRRSRPARTRRIYWSASYATKATAARGAASPRASSPSACAPATGSRSTSSRTRTSACRTIRTGRVVMIGPGTGVAPFRAFLQQRQAAGAGGRNWLFFGDRNFTHDFLYQLEWQEWLKDGLLTHLDVAFSRDQPEKIYVQHRMWQRRAELFAWLEDGAHLYVCGDEKAMAKDVHAMLAAIVADQSGRAPEAAEAYLADLRKQRRYQRDVY